MATLPVSPDLDRKARGAFFTPAPVAKYLAEWAVRDRSNRVLEPSCGEAAFLLPAGTRLRELGRKRNFGSVLHGVDIHAESLGQAEKRLKSVGLDATLIAQDFFEKDPDPSYDAVIGNPPYLRYQSFVGAARIRSLEAALKQGVRLNQLASSWAAFTVHASAFLKPGGRLALVLPAELLSVSYASQIRRFLLDRFASVRLIVFEELVFDGVLADVVLLLAEGSGGAPKFEVFQARDANSLTEISTSGWTGFAPVAGAKWTGALMPSESFGIYENLVEEHKFDLMRDWGDTSLGAVTGNNDFFCLSHERFRELGLSADDVSYISPPGSRHLHGLGFTAPAWKGALAEGKACYLFSPKGEPSAAASRYISEGEVAEVDQAYKCAVRTPWWKPNPGLVPDLIFTYMNHESPRLLRNEANAHILNSVYGVYLKLGRRSAGKQFLPLAMINSVTLLAAEVVGRSYGGGLLKFEPTEAGLLPMPSLAALAEVGPKLKLLEPQIGALLRTNEVSKIAELVDKILLRGYLGVPQNEIDAVKEARRILFLRRATRGRRTSGKNR